MRHRLSPPRDDDDDDVDDEEYDSAKWFTPVLGGETFQDAVRRVKESVRWVQRNGVFENNDDDDDDDEREEGGRRGHLGLCPGRACFTRVQVFIDVYWDSGLPGWYEAEVVGQGDAPGTLSIVYSDGEKDMRFRLSEWMWSVSAKSSEWLQEQQAKAEQDHKALVRSARRSAKRAKVVLAESSSGSSSSGEEEEEEEEEEDEEEPPLSALSSPPASPSSPPACSSPPPLRFPDSSGVLKYEDAFRYWTYEHDVRWRDPFIGDVGGNAYQIASDRWRHAFHHMPNRQFAEQLLRICTASTAKGLPRCKRKKTKKKKQRRCVMCNRQRQCDEYVLGALSPSFAAAGGVLAVALGCCCLRKLEAVIALYKALQGVRALREKPQPGSGSTASTTNDDDEVFEAVSGPVDRFNRAVDELDQAMGMDQQYRVYGSSGGGFYNVGPFGDEV